MILKEHHMYDMVYVRTIKSGSSYESAVENDKNDKRMVIGSYRTQSDAEFYHHFAVQWAQLEYERWKESQ